MARGQPESYKLYDGKVLLYFDPGKHRYTVDGVYVPSVTGITGMIDKSDPIKWWALKEGSTYLREHLVAGVPYDEVQIEQIIEGARLAHRRTMKKAADIGTLVHEWVEKYISADKSKDRPKLPVNKQVRHGVEAFLAWEKEHKVEYVFSEQKVFSIEHLFAGTVDIVAYVDGALTVVDIKTSNRIYDEYNLQVAAYIAALQEEYEDPIPGRTIIRLGKEDGAFEAHDLNTQSPFTWEDDFTAFLGARVLYRRLKAA